MTGVIDKRPLVMPTNGDVLDSLEHCLGIVQAAKTSFYWGMRLTPEPKRSAMWALYAFMRVCDDAADDDAGGEPLERIESLRSAICRLDTPEDPGTLSDDLVPILPAFRWMVETFDVDLKHFHDMLDGQRRDVVGLTVPDFDTLRGYCVQVASSVGQVCLSIWGFDQPELSRKLAEDRGVAFQLTNVLRDLAEDAQRGRCYLPAEDLERFQVTPDDLAEGRWSDRMSRLLAFQIERARSTYAMSAGLERRLDLAGRPTCTILTRTYERLLDRIAADPRATLRGRVRLSRGTKLICAVKGWRAGRK